MTSTQRSRPASRRNRDRTSTVPEVGAVVTIRRHSGRRATVTVDQVLDGDGSGFYVGLLHYKDTLIPGTAYYGSFRGGVVFHLSDIEADA